MGFKLDDSFEVTRKHIINILWTEDGDSYSLSQVGPYSTEAEAIEGRERIKNRMIDLFGSEPEDFGYMLSTDILVVENESDYLLALEEYC